MRNRKRGKGGGLACPGYFYSSSHHWSHRFNPSGGALQRALTATTIAKKLAASSLGLGNQAMKMLPTHLGGGGLPGSTPELSREAGGVFRFDTGARDTYGWNAQGTGTENTGGVNSMPTGHSWRAMHQDVRAASSADVYSEEKAIPWRGSTWVPKKPTFEQGVEKDENLAGETEIKENEPEYDGVGNEARQKDTNTMWELKEEAEKEGEAPRHKEYEPVESTNGKENMPDEEVPEEEPVANKMAFRAAPPGFLDTEVTATPQVKYGLNLLQLLGISG
eukprot:CAMPEP_0178993310 /NCGR_PEP_ID=MMETSP0795-20121207/6633_1 /TAXON_ID=88552 /ORGANISM="Amoebophrya sp., Strain Ameob2" /LENGTH=276 /DNA_ID=CAMNT_0020685357 /DNA_START=695 /DNA_END=1525 /DNA_ORIENTATION=+